MLKNRWRLDGPPLYSALFSVFQSLLADLSSRSTEFDSVAADADANTRDRRHKELDDLRHLAGSVQKRVSLRLEKLAPIVDQWHEFDSRLAGELTRLDDISGRLSVDRPDAKSSPSVLREEQRECSNILHSLEGTRQDVFQVINSGRQILQGVDCPRVAEQIRELEQKYNVLVNKAAVRTESYVIYRLSVLLYYFFFCKISKSHLMILMA
jgi:hypothetical protein